MAKTTTCSVCGGDLVESQEKTQIRVGSKAAVVDVTGSTCRSCGETFFTPEQLDAAQRAASEQLRKDENLLTPAEIRELRTKYVLTQAQLEKLLGVGAKTVVRWERGTVCQSRTADALMRLILELRQVFEYLARNSGIEPSIQEQMKGSPRPHLYKIAPARRTARKVLLDASVNDISDFRAESAIQKKKIRLEQEVALPTIALEAMR